MSSHDEEYLEGLYREMYKKMYNFANIRLNNHHLAEEAVQDTFVLALRNMKKHRASPNPQGWLVVTLSNTLKHILRTKQRLIVESLPLKEEILDGITQGTDPEYGLRELLTDEEWQLLTMIYIDGWPITEATQNLGIEYEACRKRLHRIRTKIKNELHF